MTKTIKPRINRIKRKMPKNEIIEAETPFEKEYPKDSHVPKSLLFGEMNFKRPKLYF